MAGPKDERGNVVAIPEPQADPVDPAIADALVRHAARLQDLPLPMQVHRAVQSLVVTLAADLGVQVVAQDDVATQTAEGE